eukprot:UN10749
MKQRIIDSYTNKEFMALKRTHIMSRHLYCWRYYISRNLDKHREQRMSRLHVKLLIQVRSNHLKLNLMLHVREHRLYYQKMALRNDGHLQFLKCYDLCCKSNNSGRCACGGHIEDCEHFIMTCSLYHQQRQDLMNVVEYYFAMYDIIILYKYILFPPIFMRWSHRKLILQALCTFILNTDRLLGVRW